MKRALVILMVVLVPFGLVPAAAASGEATYTADISGFDAADAFSYVAQRARVEDRDKGWWFDLLREWRRDRPMVAASMTVPSDTEPLQIMLQTDETTVWIEVRPDPVHEDCVIWDIMNSGGNGSGADVDVYKSIRALQRFGQAMGGDAAAAIERWMRAGDRGGA